MKILDCRQSAGKAGISYFKVVTNRKVYKLLIGFFIMGRQKQEVIDRKRKQALVALEDLSESYSDLYFPESAIANRMARMYDELTNDRTVKKFMEHFCQEGLAQKVTIVRGALFYLEDDSRSLLQGSRVGYRTTHKKEPEN